MNASGLIARAIHPLRSLSTHRFMIIELTKREILGRYRGASFGLMWSLISPFLMLMVYTFAFENILKNHWPSREAGTGTGSFAIILFVGIIIHGFFAECFSRSPTLITGNANYVKKVVFPLEILPLPVILSALFHASMNAGVLLVLLIVIEGAVPATAFFLPLVIAPLVVLVLGLTWGLSALGVYFRDISQITGVISTALLFTSSAIIPTEVVSEKYRFIFELNPLTIIIDQARNIVLWGLMPNFSALGLYLLAAILFTYCGYAWFMATRKGFADVL